MNFFNFPMFSILKYFLVVFQFRLSILFLGFHLKFMILVEEVFEENEFYFLKLINLSGYAIRQ